MMMTMADKTQFKLVDRTADFYNILGSQEVKDIINNGE